MKMRPLIDTFKKSNIVLPSILAAFIHVLIINCGGEEAFGPKTPGTVTDIDNNTYKTIKIGTQWWMAENLKVTHYRNGDAIPNVTDGYAWSNLTTGAYCEYNNDANIVATYGRLYNWHAAGDSRHIAPTGWHVPSDSEWQTLVDYLGGDSVAGGRMKETGIKHWMSANSGATNESGFCGLPGGYRSFDSHYYFMGASASIWSSNENSPYFALIRVLDYNSPAASRFSVYKSYGFSVRCVKD
jgi:uncharacterized protein (TIGR02145 family)